MLLDMETDKLLERVELYPYKQLLTADDALQVCAKALA